MPDVRHVRADLVGPSGFEHALYVGGITEPFDYLVVRDGGFADVGVCADGHAQTVAGVAGYVPYDGAFPLLVKVAPYKGVVFPFGSLVEELLAQRGFGFRGFGYDEQPGGVFVDAVYESYAGVVGVIVRVVAQVPSQGVDQRALPVSMPGVHDHSGWFVDDQHVPVFENDMEWDFFRYDFVLAGRAVHEDADEVLRLYPVVAFHGLPVHVDAASFCGVLYAVAGDMLEAVVEVFVNPYEGLALVGRETVVLVERSPARGRGDYVVFVRVIGLFACGQWAHVCRKASMGLPVRHGGCRVFPKGFWEVGPWFFLVKYGGVGVRTKSLHVPVGRVVSLVVAFLGVWASGWGIGTPRERGRAGCFPPRTGSRGRNS